MKFFKYIFFFFFILSLFISISSRLNLGNLIKSDNFAEGTIFVELENKLHTLWLKNTSFQWLRNNSRNLCENLLKIPTYYSSIEYYFDKSQKIRAEILHFENCCQ